MGLHTDEDNLAFHSTPFAHTATAAITSPRRIGTSVPDVSTMFEPNWFYFSNWFCDPPSAVDYP